MLIAADLSPNVQLVGADLGDFGGAASVQALQQALTGLAMAAGWPVANPGAVTGTMTSQTVMAVSGVVAHLSGKVSSKVKTALKLALFMASQNATAMGAAKTLVSSYAAYLTPAVLALTAKYTKASPPPPAPSPLPRNAVVLPFFPMKTAYPVSSTAKLPAGAVQARTKTGMYRIAVPTQFASQLGGPAVSLGAAFHELPPRSTPTTGVMLVSESNLESKTGTQPFYKKPLVLGGIAAGVAVLGGGAWWMSRS